MRRIALVGRVDEDVDVDADAHESPSRIARTASLSSKSTIGAPSSSEIRASVGRSVSDSASAREDLRRDATHALAFALTAAPQLAENRRIEIKGGARHDARC